jgi:hypothetical protein
VGADEKQQHSDCPALRRRFIGIGFGPRTVLHGWVRAAQRDAGTNRWHRRSATRGRAHPASPQFAPAGYPSPASARPAKAPCRTFSANGSPFLNSRPPQRRPPQRRPPQRNQVTVLRFGFQSIQFVALPPSPEGARRRASRPSAVAFLVPGRRTIPVAIPDGGQKKAALATRGGSGPRTPRPGLSTPRATRNTRGLQAVRARELSFPQGPSATLPGVAIRPQFAPRSSASLRASRTHVT